MCFARKLSLYAPRRNFFYASLSRYVYIYVHAVPRKIHFSKSALWWALAQSSKRQSYLYSATRPTLCVRARARVCVYVCLYLLPPENHIGVNNVKLYDISCTYFPIGYVHACVCLQSPFVPRFIPRFAFPPSVLFS